MVKILLIFVAVLGIFAGIFVYFAKPSFKNPLSPEGTIGKNIGNILGSANKSDNTDSILDETKDSMGQNVDDAKDVAYNTAKTTLDNVFNKKPNNSEEVTVNILGVNNSQNPSHTIDLSKDSNLRLNLSVNKKYALEFKNIPDNFCLYINNQKYPLKGGIVEIQFNNAGNYPIKANSCELNDRNIGNLIVQ